MAENKNSKANNFQTKAVKKTRNVSTNSSSAAKSKSTQKLTKQASRVVMKQVKKGHLWILVAIFLLVLGAASGYFGYTYLCKDDCFEMISYSNGECDITIGEEEDYQAYLEKGARCVVLGKDISSQIKISFKYREDITHDAIDVEEIDEFVAGTYYVIYTIDNLKYKSVTLIRNVFVMRSGSHE